MSVNDFIIKRGLGKYNSLDKSYAKIIKEAIDSLDESIQERWEIYNLIIRNLIKVDDGKYFSEFKYRTTDGEDASKVMSEILSRYKENELDGFMHFLKNRVESFIEDDETKEVMKKI